MNEETKKTAPEERRREIGGYLELDSYRLPMLHEEALALNSGRNALAYLLRARGIGRLLIPALICDAVTDICRREGVAYTFYSVDEHFLPARPLTPGADEWLYLVNFYGQLGEERIAAFASEYQRVIVDNAQAYFQRPVPGIDTLYTCRKYFGVADGAFLCTDARLGEELPQDESHARMGFLLGRYERPAAEFYGQYTENEALFSAEPIKRMSRLTRNLLHGIDYAAVERQRRENFAYLHERLGARNLLTLSRTGTFMYPFLTENGAALRKKLQAEKIYIPTLWPSVLAQCRPDCPEYRLAENILPLPVDQRYGPEDMAYLIQKLVE